jgi:hypothetical protein
MPPIPAPVPEFVFVLVPEFVLVPLFVLVPEFVFVLVPAWAPVPFDIDASPVDDMRAPLEPCVDAPPAPSVLLPVSAPFPPHPSATTPSAPTIHPRSEAFDMATMRLRAAPASMAITPRVRPGGRVERVSRRRGGGR